jgi:hypothetical protein
VPGVHAAAIAVQVWQSTFGEGMKARRGAGEIIQFLFFFSISLSLFFDDFSNGYYGATNYRPEI